MKGIIAGESNVEVHIPDKRYRVFITAKDPNERLLFQQCLKRLDINSIQNGDFKSIIISKKENNLQLLKQRLMTLSPEKYNKFLRMMNLYGNFEKLEQWQNNLKQPHNKIPQWKIKKIIVVFNKHSDWSAWKIAQLIGISDIKVQRVLKERNLGKRLVKTPESKRQEIAIFARKNQNLTQKQIAEIFHVHENVVRRAVDKYAVTYQNL